MVTTTNPSAIVVTAERARELGFGDVLSGNGHPVMITRQGAVEITDP
jgi:hypothetical protein